MDQSDTAKLLEAILFAAERHKNQRRKDAEASPYINHPIAVAHLLAAQGQVSDVTILQAAVLHDTIEDTETTELELRSRFGDEVTDIVLEVTDDKALPKQERKKRQVHHAPNVSRAAALVKLADKTCNLRDLASAPPADWPLQRQREYFAWAKSVVDALPEVNPNLRRVFDAVYENQPREKERMHRLLGQCCDELLAYVRQHEPLYAERWVPAAEVKQGLELNLVAVPKGATQYGEKGWLFAILARMLEDQGRLEYRREGARSYCRSAVT